MNAGPPQILALFVYFLGEYARTKPRSLPGAGFFGWVIRVLADILLHLPLRRKNLKFRENFSDRYMEILKLVQPIFV
jgi:hypothetical protein